MYTSHIKNQRSLSVYLSVFLSSKHTHAGNLDSFKIHACDGQNVYITAHVLTVGALWHKRILIPLALQFIHLIINLYL